MTIENLRYKCDIKPNRVLIGRAILENQFVFNISTDTIIPSKLSNTNSSVFFPTTKGTTEPPQFFYAKPLVSVGNIYAN